MIKRQYHYYGNQIEGSYFTRFVDSVDQSPYTHPKKKIAMELAQWKATLGKSKARYTYNVKFHDPKLYTLFVMRWS